jgi:predicted nucleic acid-binding protein
VAEIERIVGGGPVHVPAHFDAEVWAMLRRELRRERLTLAETLNALFVLRALTAERQPIADMLLDAVALRDRFGAHDVFYAILARRLGATFVTADGPLARAAEGYVDVRYVQPEG